MIYRNKLMKRSFDKEALQNSHPERATIAVRQGAREDVNFEAKPTRSKTVSSDCFGVRISLFLLSCILCLRDAACTTQFNIDLEERAQPFVLETKRIHIPGYPDAFNPSIVSFGEGFLMSFRFIPDVKQKYISYIGVILLDKEFVPISNPQVLPTNDPPSPSRAEDARLLWVGEDLYIVYSDNPEPKLSAGGFRVYTGKLHWEKGSFVLKDKERLSQFEGENQKIREKSWVPFNYQGDLLLAYSIIPHTIFYPIPGRGECVTIAKTSASLPWGWGILRGGTPGLLIDNEYFALFHSSIDMATTHSEGKTIAHYFMGAYTFSSSPPFEITRISREPIIGKNFYSGEVYQPYWKQIRCVFPCGLIQDENSLWVVYGRQDREVWVAKLDRQGIFDNLTSISTH